MGYLINMPTVDIKGNQYHIHPGVIEGLNHVKERVLKNKDMCTILVDGRHGTGKSTLAAQLAYYLSDGESTLNDVVFTPDDFVKKLKGAKPGDHIILDEAFDTINRRNSRSSENLEVLSLMQKMRTRQCFIWIVLPYMYDLDKTVVLGVADYLFHCWRKDFGDRGQYSVFRRQGIKNLYLNYKPFYAYPYQKVRPNLHPCRFSKFFPFDEKDYQKKKLDSFIKMSTQVKKKSARVEKLKKQRTELIRYLTSNFGISGREIGKVIGISQPAVSKILNELKKGENI